MDNVKKLIIAIIVVITSGCAGTSLRVNQGYSSTSNDTFAYEITDNANVSEKGMLIFKERLNLKLTQLNLKSEQSNKILEITFNNYRMRHGAARALVGIMAGSDSIISTIIIKDIETGKQEGSIRVASKNPSAWGSSKGLIEEHADKIVSYLKK